MKVFMPIFLILLLGHCGITSAIVNPIVSDLSDDGIVDLADVKIMAGHWLGVEDDTTGLLGFWKFDETSGTMAYDSSGNNNICVLHDGPVWQPGGGKFGGALSFDGSNDFVQTDNSAGKLQLAGDYTLSVWLKADSAQNTWAGILVKTDTAGSGNHWGIQFDDSGDRNLVVFHPANSWNTGIKLSDLAYDWHHICIARNGNIMTSYFDGKQVKSDTWSYSPGGGNGHLNIGTERSIWGFFKGRIDEIRIYNRALSSTEITYLAKMSADLSGDGKVDFQDFAILANEWMWPGGQMRPAENGLILLTDSFDLPDSNWQPIYLKGTTGGSYSVLNGKLNIEAATPNSIYGVYNVNSILGHFCTDVEFDNDNFCGLALIQEKNGQPDTQNFTSITVNTDSQGKVVVSVSDKQNGVTDVLDNTGSIADSRYQTILDGSVYSVPFIGTNKKIRIFRDEAAGFFHFYYAVRKQIKGEYADGWMELAPSKEWGTLGQKYYVALIVRSGNSTPARAVFDNLRTVQKPIKDRNDTKTGFKVLRGEYNWSGFFGDAVVITFGDEFDYRNSDRKFVFWSEMDYVPAWHINNQCLYSYEFIEVWGGENPGSYEPMSDRLPRWSQVEVLEDNAVRKVVHWHYVLCNPDYKVPDDSTGTQLPEGDEYWTFYPDGTGVRRIRYTPKLDGSFRNVHELTELIVIAGSLTNPDEHLATPALTVSNLQGAQNTYFPHSSFNEQTNDWNQIIATTHFNSNLDAFNVFSHASDTQGTYSYYKLNFDISWHSTGYEFCHWPVGKEPYQEDNKSNGTWKAQVSHTSLMGGGVYQGINWNDHYQIDERGRKYREWVSLVGLNQPGDTAGLCNKTKTWLYPGNITMLDSNSEFAGLNYKQKELVFNNVGSNRICWFYLDPTPGNATVINPVLKINNWGNNPVQVKINDQWLNEGNDFKSVIVDGDDAIIWIKGQFSSGTTFWVSNY